MNRPLLILCMTTLLVLSLGCVERRMVITSEPSGALVRINDEPAGRTPLEVPFTWYGVYELQLELEGYKTLLTQREAEMPWWEAPGPDLIAEALPGRKVEVAWHLELERLDAVPADDAAWSAYLDLLKVRAQTLREQNRRD